MIPDYKEHIVFFIKQTRAMAGMTRPQLAEYLGTNPETVRNWERRLTVPKADMFLAVMDLRGQIIKSRRTRRAAA